MLRLGMGAGLHFCFLDSIKAALERRHPDDKLTSMDAFIAGGVSRAGAAIISCPVTVVKTRMEYGGPGGTQYKVAPVAMPQLLLRLMGIRSFPLRAILLLANGLSEVDCFASHRALLSSTRACPMLQMPRVCCVALETHSMRTTGRGGRLQVHCSQGVPSRVVPRFGADRADQCAFLSAVLHVL